MTAAARTKANLLRILHSGSNDKNYDLRFMNYELNRKMGFTLLEILVSVTIISGLSILIAQAFFTTSRSNTKTEILKEVKQNGDFALGIIGKMVRESYGITSTCAAAGTTSTSLSIKNPDSGVTTFGCVFDSGVSRVASSSGTVDYLTSTSVTLGGTRSIPCSAPPSSSCWASATPASTSPTATSTLPAPLQPDSLTSP